MRPCSCRVRAGEPFQRCRCCWQYRGGLDTIYSLSTRKILRNLRVWAARTAGSKALMVKCALVCGAGGFIGGHLVKRLKRDGFWVRGVDLEFHEYSETEADDFVV